MTTQIDAEIQQLLDDFVVRLQNVLGGQFVGLHLYGSLASGDFDPQTSDIDFVVLTASEVGADTFASLEAMHQGLARTGNRWAAELEGSYISVAGIRRYRRDDPPRPTLNEGQFYWAAHGSDWVIQRHILRQCGVTIAGAAIAPFIDAVLLNELKGAVADVLDDWWRPMLAGQGGQLERADYRAYAVLSMCRALHTLQTGAVVSKRQAAHWAMRTLEAHRAELVAEALNWKPGLPMSGRERVEPLIRSTWQYAEQVRARLRG